MISSCSTPPPLMPAPAFVLPSQPPPACYSIMYNRQAGPALSIHPGWRRRKSPCLVRLQADRGQDTGWEKAEIDLWESRRDIARGVLRPIAKLTTHKEQTLREKLAAGQSLPGQSREEDLKQAVLGTALIVACVSAIARFGGRAAVLTTLGLDLFKDANLESNLNNLMIAIQQLGPLKLPLFFFLWTVAKCLCLDTLSMILALASGIIFGGVLPGALISTTCATGASFLGFQMARTYFRSQVLEQLHQRPLLRALERAVAKDGLKAVFTFRLSPMVPALPIGAYNYLYGVTSISTLDFLLGIFAGSLKPYFLDSYLGIWGQEILHGQTGDATDSAVLLGAFFVLILIGTFAAQVRRSFK